MQNWLKKNIRPVGLAIIASFVAFVLWLVPPASTTPAWLFTLSLSLLAISAEVTFNSIVDRKEAMSLEHRILAIRNGNKSDPILIIKPGTNVQVGNLLSVYRNIDGVVSFVALCVVDHKQDDGKTQLKLVFQDFTDSETSKVSSNDTTVISSWRVYSRVDNSVIDKMKGA